MYYVYLMGFLIRNWQTYFIMPLFPFSNLHVFWKVGLINDIKCNHVCFDHVSFVSQKLWVPTMWLCIILLPEHAHVIYIYDLSIVNVCQMNSNGRRASNIAFMVAVAFGIYLNKHRNWTKPRTTYDLIKAERNLGLAFDKNITRPFDWHMVTCETVLVCNKCFV